MAKYIYPAVFQMEGDIFNVNFPDFESCYTQGENLQDAFEMAQDVLCLTLYALEQDGQTIPKASNITDLQLNKNEFASLIICDTIEYRKFYDNKAVKKTLTIPSWLNDLAERSNVNFSAILQQALKKELQITDR